MATTNTKAPVRKVLAGGAGAGIGDAVASIVVWAIEQAIDLPPNIESAVSLIIVVACAIAAGYLMPPAPDEGAS